MSQMTQRASPEFSNPEELQSLVTNSTATTGLDAFAEYDGGRSPNFPDVTRKLNTQARKLRNRVVSASNPVRQSRLRTQAAEPQAALPKESPLILRLMLFVFKLLFNLFFHHFFALLQTVFLVVVMSAFAAAFLYFLHGEYVSFKQALVAIPGLLFNKALQALSTVLMYSWCHLPYSPQWHCTRPTIPVENVIGEMIVQVADARDIFEMFTELGRTGSASLGSSAMPIYEIADRIEIAKNIEHREILATAFRELDEQTTQFGDGIRELRATGINTAGFIVWEFKRVKQGLELHLRSPNNKVDLDKLLQNYMTSIDEHFGTMLKDVSDLIPIAEVVREQGKRIHRYLVKDHEAVDQEYNYGSLWKKWWVNAGWKGEKMRKDLDLAGQAINAITSLIQDLKTTRSNLVGYRTHIKKFKSNLNKQIPTHLSPEQEIINLSGVIDEFERSIQAEKSPSKQRIRVLGQAKTTL